MANLSPRLAEELRLEEAGQGVVIVEITRGSPAPGSVSSRARHHRQHQRTDIDTTQTLADLVGQDADFWRVEIERNGQRSGSSSDECISSPRHRERMRRPATGRCRPVCAPQSLSEVTGQDHLTGEDGILRRMIASGTLGSMIFWGPPDRQDHDCPPAER